MQIEDTRHVTPDKYSIDSVEVGYDWSDREPKFLQRYLHLKLRPEAYFRTRFGDGGESYETKKHGALSITISALEIDQIITALNTEIEICHKLLLDKGLVSELFKARNPTISREQNGSA